MTDPLIPVAERLELLRTRLEHPELRADLTLGFSAEAGDPQTLRDRMEAAILDIAQEEARAIVALDLGGVLGTDDGFRCWGTVTLAAAADAP